MLGPHDEQWQSGIEAPVGVAPEPGTMGIREGCAHRRMVAAACDLEAEHLLGCENWTPARGRRSFSFLVLGASSFRVGGVGEGGSEEGRANTCFLSMGGLAAGLSVWLNGVWFWGWWIREGYSGVAEDGTFQKPVISDGHVLWGRGWRGRRCGLHSG